MANREHLEILKKGVFAWSRYKSRHTSIRMDISGANLSGETLDDFDFSFTDLDNANLTDAALRYVNFEHASLVNANLNNAYLSGANFRQANLSGADFSDAILLYNIFDNNDLSLVIGLDRASYAGPSTIGIDTLYRSAGNLPITFLRGCGLPDTLIDYLPSLLNDPIQFYASFISYSSKDQKFADRLYSDLQNKGVRCWLATEDLKIGAKIRSGIDEAIRLHDKLLLVLSKHSVASEWVEQEVETALERERKEKRLILFPIRLDSAVMKIEGGWPALIRNTRNIGDFTHWKDHDSYQKAFARLLRDLKAEDKQTAEG